MKMVNRIYLAAAMAVLMTISCKRVSPADDLPLIPQGKPLTVEACLGAASRTTLDDDGLTLLWEAGDKIAVYSSYIGSEEMFESSDRYDEIVQMLTGLSEDERAEYQSYLDDGLVYWIESASLYPEYQRKGVLTLSSPAGTTQGVFRSDSDVDAWFGKGDSTADENYWFTAYYPARTTQYDISSYLCMIRRGNFALHAPWTKVLIPSVQDGKSWSDYQLVTCVGYDMMGFDEELSQDLEGVVSKQGILNGTQKIRFASFQPLTALLHFTLKVEEAAAENSYSISKIVISQEATWRGVARTDLYALSGVVPYFILFDAPERDGDTPLWNRYRVPFNMGNHYESEPVGDSWPETDELSNTITLAFDDPETVTKAGTGEEYYAVAIPTNACSDHGYPLLNPVLIFTAYDASDNVLFSSRLRTPDLRGLRYGFKYDFPVTLRDPNTWVQDSMPAEANGAGEYGINNW